MIEGQEAMGRIKMMISDLYEKLQQTDQKRLLAVVLISVALISGGAEIYEMLHPLPAVTEITKREPGKGETELSLDVIADEKRYRINVTVPERVYDNLELEKAFDEGERWIHEHYLGDNPDEDHVSYPLVFAEMIPETGIKIRWQPQDYRWIRSNGEISDEAFLEAPVESYVTAILSYGEAKRELILPLTIVPIEKEKLGIVGIIQEKLEMQKGDHQEERQFVLPDHVSGMSLLWYRPKAYMPMKFFIFGSLFVCLFYLSREEKKIQKRKERIMGLDQDYPEIVYQMVLLISSGSTVRAAWEKLVSDYEKQKAAGKGVRPGFEEMVYALKEMRMGIPEIRAYENFGRRCARRSYIRFSALITQQIRRGAGGMSEIMLQEVAESEVMWRENARKSAEEAGMKLLMPLVMLMAVVFAVLVIPAFLSMNF